MNPQSSLLRRSALAAIATLALFGLSGCMSLMPMMAPTVAAEKDISAQFPYESKYVQVNGSRMSYIEAGTGTPVVFIHGNPTSSYLWRNVIPAVAQAHRAIAVDLIGFGKSDKPPIDYSLDDHIRYFDGFMDAMKLKEVVLVVHDWGGPIGIDYALRHQDQVKGIVMMETLVRPMHWSETNFAMKYMFTKFRNPEQGDQLIVRDNYFVEKLIPMMAGRKLSDEEMDAYRAPFRRESDRKPIARFPREIPIDGEPMHNHERIARNFEMLKRANIPLLLLKARPGAIMNDEYVASLKESLPRITVEDIGPGVHYVQEAQPSRIGSATTNWIRALN